MQFYRREVHVMPILRSLSRVHGERVQVMDNTKQGTIIIVDSEMRDALRKTGGFLLDIAKLKDRIVLPSNGEELDSLVRQVLSAYITKEPIPIFTPVCPDWSRDSEGRYDFKSLGGGVSFIGKKFLREAPPLLRAFAKHGVPFEGRLIFANWGLETEIDAKDTYGRKLTPEDIRMSFESTFAKTDERLLTLQKGEVGALFGPYGLVRMTEFFERQGVDSTALYQEARLFFLSTKSGRRLVEELNGASARLNKERLEVTEEENKALVIQNLSEYATLGLAFGDRGIIVAAESATSTRAYNLVRKNKLPVFYLKGERSLREGVNIL